LLLLFFLAFLLDLSPFTFLLFFASNFATRLGPYLYLGVDPR